jgi:hypothetical protein
MNTNLDARLSEQQIDQEPTERKPFSPPHLEQHDKLPQITGVSGDFCEIFPDACD